MLGLFRKREKAEIGSDKAFTYPAVGMNFGDRGQCKAIQSFPSSPVPYFYSLLLHPDCEISA